MSMVVKIPSSSPDTKRRLKHPRFAPLIVTMNEVTMKIPVFRTKQALKSPAISHTYHRICSKTYWGYFLVLRYVLKRSGLIYLIRRIRPDPRGVQAWWSHGWRYPRFANKEGILAQGNSTRVEDEESTRSNMKQTD